MFFINDLINQRLNSISACISDGNRYVEIIINIILANAEKELDNGALSHDNN